MNVNDEVIEQLKSHVIITGQVVHLHNDGTFTVSDAFSNVENVIDVHIGFNVIDTMAGDQWIDALRDSAERDLKYFPNEVILNECDICK